MIICTVTVLTQGFVIIAHPPARRAHRADPGRCGVTATTALLTATRTSHIAAALATALLGLAIGLTIVPQQHRLFATVPRLAPVAVGLNGSAIYIGSAGPDWLVHGPAAPRWTAPAALAHQRGRGRAMSWRTGSGGSHRPSRMLQEAVPWPASPVRG
jgi:hypothetical protein